MIPLIIAALSGQKPPDITIQLTPKPAGLNFEANKNAGLMYSPSSIKLAKVKPASLKVLPPEWGENWFGEITVGNGGKNSYGIVIQVQGDDAKLFIDSNQNGVIGDDGVANWVKQAASSAGQLPSFQGTNTFNASYLENGKLKRSQYGLNFYWSPGRSQLNYYRSTLLEGKFNLGGKDVFVKLHEDGNDGVFNRRFDLSPDPLSLRPVTLTLNEARKDTRGTFDWEGVNYLADISADGTKVKLTPTYRVVKAPPRPANPTKRLLEAGTDAPDFRADSITGEKITLSQFKGKIVVLKFWATWCGPCIASMPHFEQLYRKVKPQGVELLALCVSDDRAAFNRWVPENKGKYSYPFFFDPAGRDTTQSISGQLYNTNLIPTVYVIDRAGKVATSVVGYQEGDKRVDDALAKLGVVVN